MKIALVYSSRTGNTKKVAEAVKAGVSEIEAFASADAVDFNVDDYDTYIVCYWVDKGFADENSLEFYKKLTGKKIVTIGTLGVAREHDHAKRMSEKVGKSLEEAGNTIVGAFACQGKIDPKLTEGMKKFPEGHPHAWTPERQARHEEAQKHPDEKDCADAVECVKTALGL